MNAAQLAPFLDYETWARTFYRIKDKHDKYVPLVLRKNQRLVGQLEQRLLRTLGKARIFILKGRQGGFTTDQQARSLHLCWANPGAVALTLTHDGETTERVFQITTRALDLWPDELRSLLPTLGEKNANEVSFPGLDAVFYTGTAGSKRSGRGLTPLRFHGSEFAFWTDPMGVLNGVAPGLERPGTSMILETTASGYGAEAHEFYRDAKRRGWEPFFTPWWECDPEIYRTPLMSPDELGALEPDEAELVRVHGLDLEQIKWRREKIAGPGGRPKFLQEYAEDEETCWIATGGLFYDAEKLKALLLRAPEPVKREPFRAHGEIRYYGEKRDGVRYIIGGDVAEGVGGDRSTAVVRGFTDAWPLLADYEDNLVDPNDYADLLAYLGRMYADKSGPAFLVIEKNAHGITTLRRLRDHHKYPIHRIYHRQAFDKDTKDRKDAIGFYTGEETKPLLLDGGRLLIAAALNGTAMAPSKNTVRDAFGVQRDPKTGRVNTTGRDLLMAELLAWHGRGFLPSMPDVPPAHW